jgi:opacity protein-like surface antigen
MKKFGILLSLIVLVAMFASQAQAFDGDRKGFVLNLGAGAGQGKLKLSNSSDSISDDGIGFSTDFKIGAGLSSNSVLYYSNRVIWWSSEGVSVTTGMSAVAFSYFFSPEAPSFFLSGSIGIGVASIEDLDSESGAGFGIGAGFEFAKNWTVEASYLSAKVWEEFGVSLTASNLALTVSWFAY